MLSAHVVPAVIAITFGVIIAIALFVPFVAIQYRRRGSLGFGPVVLSFGVLVYSLALVAYTLLPLPVITDDFCSVHAAGVQLQPGMFVADIIRESSHTTLLKNPALLQVIFNVALFLPLGMFVRYLYHRGIIVTTLIGFAVSAIIETTQLTGVWFAFPCAYRLFDVDDLLANTLGALAGALLAPLLRIVPGQRLAAPGAPRSVTVARRLLGMLCDWIALVGIGGVTTTVYGIVIATAGVTVPGTIDGVIRQVTAYVVPAIVQLILVLSTRRTLGELVVRLRPHGQVSNRRAALRWLVGIGGFSLLGATSSLLAAFLAFCLVVASLIAVLATSGHRGLAYRAVGWRVEDDREAAALLEPRS